MIDKIIDYQTENRYQLRRLVQSIEASYGELNLLICICDNPYYRDEIIHDYEAELTAKGVNCDRVQIDRDRPSLKQSLLDRHLYENTERSELVTVLGIDGLLNVSRERDLESTMTVNRSAQAQFFFSTQWTREALREFRFPVILWITEAIAGELSRQAPDFWSWRGGLFEFVRPLVAANGDFDLRDLTIDLDDSDTSKSSANPEAIKAQIDQILATDPDSPLLRSLYLSLGIAYFDQSRKNIITKHADLENAVSAYHRVLELSAREAYPEEWAMAEHKLGTVYSDRILGNHLDNLEEAIHCFYLALEVRTRDAYPEEWARTQHNLAIAYSNRIRGNKATNLEEAIRCYYLALEIFTRETYPETWAGTQLGLGNAYQNRVRGEQSVNLERAIEFYQCALEVYIRETYPEQWAMTQTNLATAYSNRILGEKSENLERAIENYLLVLEIYNCENHPREWAMTNHNLAITYSARIKGEKVSNLEQAIRCYQLALEIFTPEAYPVDWGKTNLNLAVAYQTRISGDRATNLKQSINCFKLALTIFTHETYPKQWIQIQMNLVQAQQELLKKSAN
jgi:tetratricopeptide (TPR) repeat protein